MTKKIKCSGEYCCDFETTSYNQYIRDGFTKVYLYKIVSLKDGVGEYGISCKEFFNFVEKHKEVKKIYFHNLSFDGSFIINYLLNNNYKWKEKIDLNSKEKCFSSIIDNFGSIYSITLQLKDRIIIIQCSYKLTGLSIKDLGKLVNLDKLNETHNYEEYKDYKNIDEFTKEELSYIDNDVEIMRRGILACYEMGIRGLTTSSACYKMWKHISWGLLKDKIVPCEDKKVNHIIDASYRGGITMINKKYAGKVLSELRDYDVNSLYPSVMYKKMPIGLPLVAKNDKDIPFTYDLRIYEVVVDKVRIINGYIPFIPTTKSFIYKDSYNYDYEVKNTILYLWGDEFDLFKLYYEGDYKVANIVAYKSMKDMFKPYLDKFKKIKEEAPNPSPERTFAKGCMNKLYGKFAQTSNRISKRPFLNNEGLVEYDNFEVDLGTGYDRKIASLITSYARCILIKAINKNPERFVYCDTDSIYILGDYDYDIPTDQKKLGYWKYEASYYQFKGLKAKCYISTMKPTGEIHSAIAGLPKDAQSKLTFDTFKNGLLIQDAKKQLKRVKGGIIIVPISFTIKVDEDKVLTSGNENQ